VTAERIGGFAHHRVRRTLKEEVAGWTGLEPAASGVTGRRYNQLNYHPAVTRMVELSEYRADFGVLSISKEVSERNVGNAPNEALFNL
jgi:hypothetical protein